MMSLLERKVGLVVGFMVSGAVGAVVGYREACGIALNQAYCPQFGYQKASINSPISNGSIKSVFSSIMSGSVEYQGVSKSDGSGSAGVSLPAAFQSLILDVRESVHSIRNAPLLSGMTWES